MTIASPDNGYGSSSPEPQQSSPRNSPSPGNTEKNTYVRFLVSNAEAGSVIGKGGSTINDFQSQSGARIQLSRNYEYFPGTSDRIIMVSGTAGEVLKAVDLILTKLMNEFYVEDGGEAEPRPKLRIVVPNGSCGGLIGRGGATIKSFIEESHAGIKISPQDGNYLGLSDRLVMVTGTLEEQMQAIELILLKLAEDSLYSQSVNVPFPYAGMYNGINHGVNGTGVKFQNNRFHNKDDRSDSVTIGVADEHVGLVVGRGGRGISDISQRSGARIKISDRGDFIPGTSDRKVTITGPQRAIHVAEMLISNKVAAASER